MKKLLLSAIVILSFSAVSFGQNNVSATATATGTIIAPLTITETANMNFGNVAVQALSGGTVALTAAAAPTRTPTGGVTLPNFNKGTISSAAFSVTGQPNYTYAITLPSSATTVTSSTNTMTVDTWTSSPTPTGTLAADGTQTLYVGATLNVGAAQVPGTYVSGTGFTVTVNYN